MFQMEQIATENIDYNLAFELWGKDIPKSERKDIDPVFLISGLFNEKHKGQKVYKYEAIERKREEILKKKAKGEKITELIPQKGFQETVLLKDADIKIIGGKRGGGKMQPLDCKVVTPFGLRRLGDLKVGDIITDPSDGGMQKVLQIFEHKDKDIYKVNFADGTSTECGLEHLWLIKKTNYIHKKRHLNGTSQDDDWRVWTFEMIKDYLDLEEKRGTAHHLLVPLTKSVKFTRAGASMAKPNLDPYVIGVLIGDGCLVNENYPKLTTADVEVVEELQNAGVKVKELASRADSLANEYSVYDCDDLKSYLKKWGLAGKKSGEKFIPNPYKFGTLDVRWAILQGLMDTDGYIDKSGHCVYTTVSPRLASDIQFIVQSLGGTATITQGTAGYKKNGVYVQCQDAYDIYIRMQDTSRMFRLPRRKERCKPFNGGVSDVHKRIVSYEYVGKKDARCLTVSSRFSLYCTDDFIVTHNTFISLFQALTYINNPDVNMYGFRKYEDDISRGIWKSSKMVFKGLGIAKPSYFEWEFPSGASMKMEHLQDEKKISDRFRGVEMAYIDIEELPEHTKENLDVLFTLLSSNRSTAGVTPRCVCTCNPVGKSNKLRHFLDWYIDEATDTIIPERDGAIRYFYPYGKKINEIAWGNTPEEVYNNINVKSKIDKLCESTGEKYTDFITSLCFIEGNYEDNKILKASDPKYMNRISARGGESTSNDIEGVWRDIDDGDSLLTAEDMEEFFGNTEQSDGFMRASCDVALTTDFMVLYAFNGHHIVDIEAWMGTPTDEVVDFVKKFLNKNGVRNENFTYDYNGLGIWLADNIKGAIPFNNKSASSDPRMWNNLKSECAERFVQAIKKKEFSIREELLDRIYTDKKGIKFSVRDRLMAERRAVKRKENDGGRFEIIQKPQMRLEVGHSPDFIEAFFMVMHLFGKKKQFSRKGFGGWIG